MQRMIGALIVMMMANLVACAAQKSVDEAANRPNIIYILADDMGYGDVQALNPEGKIKTPHLDRLTREGMAFTDVHSSSAVCTPTRYGVLTGRYNWRTRLQRGVLGGFSKPLIDRDRLTVAELLKQQGYATAMVGKWHLGVAWPMKGGGVSDDAGDFSRGYDRAMDIDYKAPIVDGPLEHGFDYYFGIAASLDMPPYLYIRNRMATEVPTKQAPLWGKRNGPVGDHFKFEDVLPRFTEEAVAFIDRSAKAAKAGKPFFLYMPLNSPHTPITPSEKWKGKSGISDYADFVMETDDSVGQLMAALDKAGIAENTLIIFTSDNGCSPAANFGELAKHGHDPSYVFRGNKADIYEGGHRIPFIVRWPAQVKAGSTSDQTLCLTDFMATAADITGAKLPGNAGEDSVSILSAMKGQADQPLREATVHHSINGSFSIRQGPWKLELCPGSGGWSNPRPGKATKGMPPVQLYNLDADIAETQNLQAEHPEIVKRLTGLLTQYVESGRSTPGPVSSNDVEVDMFKGHKPAFMQ
ncbi:arylsulfatase [Planctomycetales bacterium ZRK34]|nr:arylsulfatase [Planctomycetales bacterium ZRK34]